MSPLHLSSRVHSQRGLSLVELMVAMAIGLFMSAMIATIFVSSKNSSRYQEATARLQENARFAMDQISKGIRNAGYRGCGQASRFANVVTGGEANWWLNLGSPLVGYEGGVTIFPAEISSPIANTDAVIAVGVDNSNEKSIVSHSPAAVPPAITTTQHSIQKGSVVVVSDCAHTTVFQMSGPVNTSNNATTLEHTDGAVVGPGNCYKGLGENCSGPEKSYTFQPGASLTQLYANAFYIAASSSGSGRSLWAVALGDTGTIAAAKELVEGVDNMQLEYGEDTDGDGVPNGYVVASSVASWAKVVTVRVSLLMSTLEDNVTSAAQTYNYNNQSITATDRRLRRAYTSVVTLRNRSS